MPSASLSSHVAKSNRFDPHAPLPLTDDILDAIKTVAQNHADGRASHPHITLSLLADYALPMAKELIELRTKLKELQA